MKSSRLNTLVSEINRIKKEIINLEKEQMRVKDQKVYDKYEKKLTGMYILLKDVSRALIIHCEVNIA